MNDEAVFWKQRKGKFFMVPAYIRRKIENLSLFLKNFSKILFLSFFHFFEKINLTNEKNELK